MLSAETIEIRKNIYIVAQLLYQESPQFMSADRHSTIYQLTEHRESEK